MRAVGLRAPRDRLNEYVRLAAAGETIVVTDGERVVAELVPPAAERTVSTADGALEEIVHRGWLTPPIDDGSGPPPRLPVAALASLIQELDQDRADR